MPFTSVVPGILPGLAQSDRLYFRLEAPRGAGRHQGRNPFVSLRLYIWQRITAALLVPMIVVHIAVIFYAARKGLSASDILMRTRGSLAWAMFYGAFVLAASVHGSIGVRNVLAEWSPLGDRGAGIAAVIFAASLVALGLRAVAAVVLS